MDIGKKIALCRKEAGLSQEALAAELGISRQAVSRWETGEAVPDTAKVIELSRIFSVTTDYLLLDEQEKVSRAAGSNELMDALNRFYLWLKKLLALAKPSIKQMAFPLLLGAGCAISALIFKSISEHYPARGYAPAFLSIGWILYIAGILFLLPSLGIVVFDVIKKLRRKEG